MEAKTTGWRGHPTVVKATGRLTGSGASLGAGVVRWVHSG